MDTTETEESPESDPEMDDVEQLADALDAELEKRRWVKLAVAVLAAREPHDACDRVAFAYNAARIEACERIVRILRSDLPGTD